MSAVDFRMSAASTLSVVNGRVTKEEGRFGPLQGIGNDGSSTTLSFADEGDVVKGAVIAPQDAGTPKIPDGSTLVCTGTIFIQGVLTLCAATRPN